MKKIFAFLIVLALCFGITACGNRDSRESTASSSTQDLSDTVQSSTATTKPSPDLNDLADRLISAFVNCTGIVPYTERINNEDGSILINVYYDDNVYDDDNFLESYTISADGQIDDSNGNPVDLEAFYYEVPVMDLSEGILVCTYVGGDRYSYNATGTHMCTTFTVELTLIDPETGNYKSLRKFSSMETHSCSAGFYGYLESWNACELFSEDLTKMTATLTKEDGSEHVGWIDESGSFTDVSAQVASPVSDFSGGMIRHCAPRFFKNYLYYKDQLPNGTFQVRRVKIDSLSPDSVETMREGMDYSMYTIRPDGTLSKFDSGNYYDESMKYESKEPYGDWVSESKYVGSDCYNNNDTIYLYDLEGQEDHMLYTWYTSKIEFIPDVKGRENWNPRVSPDHLRVAFLSRMNEGTDQSVRLFIVPVEGGEPQRVNTLFTFLTPASDYICKDTDSVSSLLDWR